MPKVSIVIPVYNVEKYLPQCLDSAINQTLKDIEIICVNDCSPDNSIKILNEYAEKDSRIKVIDLKENKGLGNARNLGIENASGEYIMFLDSDDWYEFDACQTAYEQIKNYNNDFAIFGLYNYDEESSEKTISKKTSRFNSIIGIPNATLNDIENVFRASAEAWYKIYNRNFLINNGIKFDLCTYEGQTWNLKIFSLAKSFSFIDKPIYNYRIRNNSITSSSSNWRDLISQKERAYEMFKTLNFQNKENVYKHYLAYLIITVILFFKRYTKLDPNIKNDFYNEVHRFFTKLSSENDISTVKDYIDYPNFKAFVKYKNVFVYNILYRIVRKIFSVNNRKRHKEIYIMGIKLSLKNKKK